MEKTILITSLICIFFLSACKTKKETSYSTDAETIESRESEDQRLDRPPGDRKGPRSVDEVFKMDTNGDNFISKEEAQGRLKERFDRIDANGDGLISKEEFKNAPRPQRGQGGKGGQRPRGGN